MRYALPVQKVIVDGYNVIHADESLKRMAARGLEDARGALVARLRDYLAERSVSITVVFDGAGRLTDVDVAVPGRLQLLFTAGGQTADEMILRMLEESSNPREYIVVTSDMTDIGRNARAMGACVVRSGEFLARIRPKRGRSGSDGGSERDSMPDVDFWLGQFGRDSKDDGGEPDGA